MGMDVIWTGEFANAGWVEQWTGADEQAATEGVFPSVAETARFEDKLWAAPIWTNTQLLWYRKDRVPKPPKTWDEMFQQAAEIGKDGLIEVQANRYEGLVVWFNSMVESAGTSIVQPDDARRRRSSRPTTEKALGLMVELANSPLRGSVDVDLERGHGAALVRGRHASFMLNYPFVYPSAKENAPDVFKNLGAALYPRVDADRPSAPPLGGINLGVSSYSEHKQEAFDAIKCMIQPAEPDRDRDRRRAAAGHREALRREGDRQGLPGLRRSDPRVDREGGAAAGDARLPGPLAGDPAHDPPARRHRAAIRRRTRSMSFATTSRPRST